MIVESMNDEEFVLEVVRDYFDEMHDYVQRARERKKVTKRHASYYTSKRGNKWLLIYRPENNGMSSLHIKRLQPKGWFTWYCFITGLNCITIFGFNKHVAERISERYHPELTPSEALLEMLMKTPAIIQVDNGKEFYTRVNGGVCIGSVYRKVFFLPTNNLDLEVDLRDTSTFISDDMLFDDQKKITEESITLAIHKLGEKHLPDHDLNRDFTE
jgi:hypothetical protein